MKTSRLVAALLMTGIYDLPSQPKKRELSVKNCLKCEVPHTHNNSFCSVKCCKAYKRGDL
jgi:hypothetical protein